MQRVLHEILRRSYDTDRSLKNRKQSIEARQDGMFAETSFNRETRGARPGMTEFKRKRTDSVTPRPRKMYKSG
jgi:hypothetical protein